MLFFILLSIILFFFCLYFYHTNKKLKQKIIELEQETKNILERKIIINKEDLISIETISKDKDSIKEKDNNSIKIPLKEKQTEQLPKTSNSPLESLEKKYTAKTNEVERIIPDIKNPIDSILNPIETKDLTELNFKQSKNKEVIPTNKVTSNNIPTVSMTIDFNPNEFIKTATKIVTNVNENINYKNDEYLKEIAKQLEEELIPQTVDLTDYEKEEEEHAIISYQELLSLKEQTNNENKKDKTFLEDLKTLRNLLDQNT